MHGPPTRRRALPVSVNPSAYFGSRSLGRIRNGQMVRFDSLEQGPVTAERDGKRFTAHGLKSALGLPFRMDSTSSYLVCASHRARPWPDSLVHQLTLVAEVFSTFIARRRAEQELDDVAGKLIQAQEEERKRIGRELHDHIGARMAMLAVSCDRLDALQGTDQATSRHGAVGLEAANHRCRTRAPRFVARPPPRNARVRRTGASPAAARQRVLAPARPGHRICTRIRAAAAPRRHTFPLSCGRRKPHQRRETQRGTFCPCQRPQHE